MARNVNRMLRNAVMSEMNRFEMLATREWLDRVDAWRVKQPGIPSRGEAIRRLVEAALGAKGSNRT
jgi:hypothetical protein